MTEKSCYFTSPKIVDKKWGREIWIHNDSEYCGKILEFNSGAKFSNHFHLLKKETWYVLGGTFRLIYLNTEIAELKTIDLSKGSIVEIPRGCPHQLICVEKGSIAEFSTEHFDSDSYRIEAGDSQEKCDDSKCKCM